MWLPYYLRSLQFGFIATLIPALYYIMIIIGTLLFETISKIFKRVHIMIFFFSLMTSVSVIAFALLEKSVEYTTLFIACIILIGLMQGGPLSYISSV